MLRITKLTDYATVLLTLLAENHGRRFSAAELSERSRIEATTVAKVLKLLAQAGLVAGFRGAHGGYRLAAPAEQIPLIAIVEALEGPLGMTACSTHDGDCGIETHCGIRDGWQRINDVVINTLRRTTLADMMIRTTPCAPAWDDSKSIPVTVIGEPPEKPQRGAPP